MNIPRALIIVTEALVAQLTTKLMECENWQDFYSEFADFFGGGLHTIQKKDAFGTPAFSYIMLLQHLILASYINTKTKYPEMPFYSFRKHFIDTYQAKFIEVKREMSQ